MGADAEGQRARLERVFTEHADAVRRYARLHIDDASADDVVAETFLVAWRRIDDIPTAVLPWLLGVARNVVSNQHRGRARHAALVTRLERQPALEHGPTVSEEVADRRALLAALGRLDPTDQELLLMWAWFDVTASQGATIVGCSTTAYAVRLHRARRRMRRLLREDSAPATPRRLTREKR